MMDNRFPVSQQESLASQKGIYLKATSAAAICTLDEGFLNFLSFLGKPKEDGGPWTFNSPACTFFNEDAPRLVRSVCETAAPVPMVSIATTSSSEEKGRVVSHGTTKNVASVEDGAQPENTSAKRSIKAQASNLVFFTQAEQYQNSSVSEATIQQMHVLVWI